MTETLDKKIRFDLVRSNPPFSTALNHVRWISAFTVLVFHVRNNLFLPYSKVAHPSIPTKIFYLLTNLADEVVICFFVISGVLVGGKCLTGFARRDFSFSKYAVDRASRLYTVLLPALALGAILIGIANWLGFAGSCSRVDYPRMLASLAFLQNVVVSAPCNNPPLWSLANEFWYYLLVPIFLYVVTAHGAQRLMAGVGLVAVVTFLALFDSSTATACCSICSSGRSGS